MRRIKHAIIQWLLDFVPTHFKGPQSVANLQVVIEAHFRVADHVVNDPSDVTVKLDEELISSGEVRDESLNTLAHVHDSSAVANDLPAAGVFLPS